MKDGGQPLRTYQALLLTAISPASSDPGNHTAPGLYRYAFSHPMPDKQKAALYLLAAWLSLDEEP
jgi:hypothetical protein